MTYPVGHPWPTWFGKKLMSGMAVWEELRRMPGKRAKRDVGHYEQKDIAKASMEGKTIKEVAVELFEGYLENG